MVPKVLTEPILAYANLHAAQLSASYHLTSLTALDTSMRMLGSSEITRSMRVITGHANMPGMKKGLN